MNKLVTITGPAEQPLLRAHEWDFKDGATLAQVDWWSTRMARAPVLPDHLKAWVDGNGTPIANLRAWQKANPKLPYHLDAEATTANLTLIVSQAFAWNMPPQQLAQACFIARGKIGYEGKLIQALIEREVGNLDVEYSGKGDGLTAVVTGPRPGDGKRVSVSGSLAEWATRNDDGSLTPQWKGGEHKQRMMMRYRGVREWARAHAPHLVLGIVGDDEMEALQEDFRARRAVDISAIPSPPKAKPPVEDQPPPGGGPTSVSAAGYRVEGDADHTGPSAGAPPEELAEDIPEHFTIAEEPEEPAAEELPEPDIIREVKSWVPTMRAFKTVEQLERFEQVIVAPFVSRWELVSKGGSIPDELYREAATGYKSRLKILKSKQEGEAQ